VKLEHGKTYLNGENSRIKITKEKWDCYFVGYSEKNRVFMGYYTETGFALGGEPRLANLIKEN
jgi:hypothetical protein